MRTRQEVLDIVNALPAITAVRKAAAGAPMSIYLTGSGLRNVFLGIPTRNFDFIVDDETHRLARQVATVEPGGMLDVDSEAGTARYRAPALGSLQFFPANGLSADQYLQRFADFTVNAAVFDLNGGAIVDCHGSLADIQGQRIRSVSPTGLADRPAHFPLRAIRLALLTPAFALEAGTRAAIEAHARSVERAAAADVGYELQAILNSREYLRGVKLLGELGLFHSVLRNAFPFAAALAAPDDGVRGMVDVDEVIRLFTLHDDVSAPYQEVVSRHITVTRQVVLLTAALRRRGLDISGDEGTRFLKTHGETLERTFGSLSAQYSSRGICAFRVRMVTVGYWLGMASLARGATLDEALEHSMQMFGTCKGLLCALLIGADWLALQRGRTGEHAAQVQDALQRLWPQNNVS